MVVNGTHFRIHGDNALERISDLYFIETGTVDNFARWEEIDKHPEGNGGFSWSASTDCALTSMAVGTVRTMSQLGIFDLRGGKTPGFYVPETGTSLLLQKPAVMQPGDPDWYGDHIHDWQEIFHYVSTNQVPMIRRNREGQARYVAWMKETLAKYKSVEEYLLSEKLNFSSLPPSPDPIHRPPVIILPNDFPYSTEPGIVHILLWSETPLLENYVQELLEKHYGSTAWEWIYFVNPPATQSIRGLPHVHVFMRPRTLAAPAPTSA